MKIKHLITTSALTFVLMAPVAALAAQPTRPGPEDSRIRSVVYKARDVTQIKGHYGFTTSIEFADDEVVETVSVGDSEAWQIVKPSQPNLLFVKPLEANADTNMTVVTNKRIYSFMMFADQAVSYQGRDLTFHVKFVYPDQNVQVIMYENARVEAEEKRKKDMVVSASAVSPENWNFGYKYDGSEAIRPHRVFDDGVFTYFKFPTVTNTPAIFSVDAEGNEALINYNVKGEYIVVERVGSQFTLRDGSLATCIFNMAMPNANYDSLSPMRIEKKSGLGGLFSKKAG